MIGEECQYICSNEETIGQRSMAMIDQVRAAEARASELEAVNAIAYYAEGPGGIGAPGDETLAF